MGIFREKSLNKVSAPEHMDEYIRVTTPSVWIALIAVAVLTVTGVGLLVPWLNDLLFSDVVFSGSTTALVGVGIFLICVTISRILFTVIRSLMTTRITMKISFSTQAAAMMRILALPPSFFREFSAGELSKRSGYISELCSQIVNMIFNTGLTAVFSLVYISEIFIYAPALVAPSLIVTLATLAVSVIHILIQIRVSRKAMLAGGKESGLTYQLISGECPWGCSPSCRKGREVSRAASVSGF